MSQRAQTIFLVALIAVILVLQGVAWAIAFQSVSLSTGAADASRPAPERLEDAQTASELRPDVLAYKQQAASLEASALVEAGELEAAKQVLVEVWGYDRDNTELREQIREINDAMTARDNPKAHVLHQREGPMGELEPEDLMP